MQKLLHQLLIKNFGQLINKTAQSEYKLKGDHENYQQRWSGVIAVDNVKREKCMNFK